MNKLSRILVLSVISIVVLTGCSEFDKFENKKETGIREKYLVDKIYDYHNNLLAEYIYDEDNRLTKRVVKDRIVESHRTIERRWEDEFEYKDERIIKIKTYNRYIDNSSTGFRQENNTETIFEYNSRGELIKSGDLSFRYENGRVVGYLNENKGSFFITDTIVYNNSDNVTQHINIYPELNMFGQPIAGTTRRVVNKFNYDNKPKPNFGIDYLFAYDPFPYLEEAELERRLSKNNMTEYVGKSKWSYTYNKQGLPITIEIKWKDVETLEPMLMRITYKSIE
jgi:hypothetical protein